MELRISCSVEISGVGGFNLTQYTKNRMLLVIYVNQFLIYITANPVRLRIA